MHPSIDSIGRRLAWAYSVRLRLQYRRLDLEPAWVATAATASGSFYCQRLLSSVFVSQGISVHKEDRWLA